MSVGTGTLGLNGIGISQAVGGTIVQAASAGAVTINGNAGAINLTNTGNGFTGVVGLANTGSANAVSLTNGSALTLGVSF